MTIVSSVNQRSTAQAKGDVQVETTKCAAHRRVLFTVRCAAMSTPMDLVAEFFLDLSDLNEEKGAATHDVFLAKRVVDEMCASVAEAAGVCNDEVELFVKTNKVGRSVAEKGNSSSGLAAESRMVPLLRVISDLDVSKCRETVTLLNGILDIFAVFRLRGGKGKAGFQKTLQRKGREFTRAVRNGQIVTAGALAAAGPRTRTPGARRFGGDRLVNTRFAAQAVTSPTAGATAARKAANNRSSSLSSRGGYAGRSSHASGRPLDVDRLPPDHPLEQLKREQAREQAIMSDWSDRMASAIGNGIALLQSEQSHKGQ